MKLIALPSGLIINLEAVAIIGVAPLPAPEGGLVAGLTLSYLAIASTKTGMTPMHSKLRGADVEALLGELDQLGILTGHIRERLKRKTAAIQKAKEDDIDVDDE